MAQCTTIWSSLVSSFETDDRETGGILGGGYVKGKTVFSILFGNSIRSQPACLHFRPCICSGSLHENPIAGLKKGAGGSFAINSIFLGLEIFLQKF